MDFEDTERTAVTPWLIDLAKKLLLNRYTLMVALVAAAYTYGHIKGAASVHTQETTQDVQEAAQATINEEKVEVSHDKRVRKILSAPVSDADAERMLSRWPDETSSSRSPSP